jgi:hypothetical protein
VAQVAEHVTARDAAIAPLHALDEARGTVAGLPLAAGALWQTAAGDAQWTAALKHLLTVLKWLLAKLP